MQDSNKGKKTVILAAADHSVGMPEEVLKKQLEAQGHTVMTQAEFNALRMPTPIQSASDQLKEKIKPIDPAFKWNHDKRRQRKEKIRYSSYFNPKKNGKSTTGRDSGK